MGIEIDLLSKYPKVHRDLDERANEVSDSERNIAMQFGQEFFDGERRFGYGGYIYKPHYWQDVVKDIVAYYELDESMSVLDVGCAKGFFLYDLSLAVPGISVKGVDISSYAIHSAKDEIRQDLLIANASSLPFDDSSFDLVISINTIHNLEETLCAQSLQEIERVSRGKSFIVVDAYETMEQKQRMYAWNLTAKTIKHVDKWRDFFRKSGYTGDYYWFNP